MTDLSSTFLTTVYLSELALKIYERKTIASVRAYRQTDIHTNRQSGRQLDKNKKACAIYA